ncbi:hypothetical protein JR316_0000022 [Psilocybe cubensis]|uniref:Uncharacterized protein n=2 Tax=Psilocybe cubensis TaxID=181762 RepID=A0ACB8HDE7_PSICU|nr:hypothetical protein JR316_0005423 [Psilocybe cubensis]XP_047753586.1 hypothetical protein JR316_0000022 [Psilocybe cubensis]KAH9483317.1 hypothetical protein JR316_0005423 [Psilocybe cubensis]KAH9485961.1 hypothetical protein JR316_0000022 [Psilocybe cubensis]
MDPSLAIQVRRLASQSLDVANQWKRQAMLVLHREKDANVIHLRNVHGGYGNQGLSGISANAMGHAT